MKNFSTIVKVSALAGLMLANTASLKAMYEQKSNLHTSKELEAAEALIRLSNQPPKITRLPAHHILVERMKKHQSNSSTSQFFCPGRICSQKRIDAGELIRHFAYHIPFSINHDTKLVTYNTPEKKTRCFYGYTIIKTDEMLHRNFLFRNPNIPDNLKCKNCKMGFRDKKDIEQHEVKVHKMSITALLN